MSRFPAFLMSALALAVFVQAQPQPNNPGLGRAPGLSRTPALGINKNPRSKSLALRTRATQRIRAEAHRKARSNAASESSGFVTSYTPVALVGGNGYVGWAGMKFTTGPSQVSVQQLGRMALQGNTATHTLKLVDAATGSDVPNASVTVRMAGATTGEFRYGTLSRTVTLPANTAYYLVSSEVMNTDDTYYADLTTTSVAVVNSAVYYAGGSWVLDTGASTYGPLDFRYTTADSIPPTVSMTTPLPGQTVSGTITLSAIASDNVAVAGVTFMVDGSAVSAEDTAAPYTIQLDTTAFANGSHNITALARDTSNVTTMSAAVTVAFNNTAPPQPFVTGTTTLVTIGGNGFVGWAGMRFTTGSVPITVSALGRMAVQANTSTHTLKIVSAATRLDVAGSSTSVSMAGAPTGQFQYAALSTPIVLSAFTSYYIVSSEDAAVDMFDYANVNTTTAGTADRAVYFDTAWVEDPGGKTYGPVNFKYVLSSPASDTTPPTVTLTAPTAGQSVSGTVSLTANAADNVAVAGVTFRIDGISIGVEDTSPPYSVVLDSRALTNITHTITAVARDSSNLTTTSAPVNISVNNGTNQIRFMPLGDSITLGFVSPNSPNNEDGGYRRFLWERLIAQGFSNLNFVGSLRNGLPTIDRDHEGHSNYTNVDLSTNINSWLATNPPSTIILMIGINDLQQGFAPQTALNNLGVLIDQILAASPSCRIAVSSILGLRQNSQYSVSPSAISTYNAGIPNVVSARAAAGKPVVFVDAYSLAALDTSLTSTDYGGDGIHPSPTGYARLADIFHRVLSSQIVQQ
jgi:lysophospholipase L1-like esterase